MVEYTRTFAMVATVMVEALDVTALEIGPEIAPGAPALRTGEVALALKSGNFGDADFFAKAVDVMERPA